MERIFDRIYLGVPFTPFNTPHIIALFAILAANMLIILFRSRVKAYAGQGLRISLAIALGVLQLGWTAWVIANGEASVNTLLPLHLCSMATLVTAAMLLANDKRWFDYTYYLGTGGAVFALSSPDVGSYNFPHFVFTQTMLVHGLLLTSQIYLAAVEGWRPSNRAVLKVLVLTNIYMVLIFIFNQLTGSNYLFIAYKPDFPA